jgi:hypothetical protein
LISLGSPTSSSSTTPCATYSRTSGGAGDGEGAFVVVGEFAFADGDEFPLHVALLARVDVHRVEAGLAAFDLHPAGLRGELDGRARSLGVVVLRRADPLEAGLDGRRAVVAFAVDDGDRIRYDGCMSAMLETFTTDGRVVISFPESALSPDKREEFLTLLKSEWSARQSRMTKEDATRLAKELDAGWWSRNRERILGKIGES